MGIDIDIDIDMAIAIDVDMAIAIDVDISIDVDMNIDIGHETAMRGQWLLNDLSMTGEAGGERRINDPNTLSARRRPYISMDRTVEWQGLIAAAHHRSPLIRIHAIPQKSHRHHSKSALAL